MQSFYSDIFTALSDATFSIPDVTVRKPYDESSKTYPLIVVHEIVNVPRSHGTVTGETTTALSYQLDIQTQNCLDASGNVLSRFDAGRLLVGEVTDLLESEFKLTRRTCLSVPIAADVLSHIWRGDCVADSHDYSYRM